MKKKIVSIGIDLDNTIINYEAAFIKGALEMKLNIPGLGLKKKDIRKYLRSYDHGEKVWQKLQGQVYGRLISNAELYDGCYRFLWRCKQLDIPVDIVSHKTQFGHFDEEKIPLRTAATDFLRKYGVDVGKNALIRSIYFESSYDDKIQRILQGKYDYFIDDLPEVLCDPKMPTKLKRILFGKSGAHAGVEISCSTWSEIEERLLGWLSEEESLALVEKITSEEVVQISPFRGGGNAGLFKVALGGNRNYALKCYPVKRMHDRLNAEFDSFGIIRQIGIYNVPLPYKKNNQFNVAMYEWVDGVRIETPNAAHIKSILSFLKQLHCLRKSSLFNDFSYASDAFISCSQFEKRLQERVSELLSLKDQYSPMRIFLTNDFMQSMNLIVDWVRSQCSTDKGYSMPLDRSKQTLSPSDFGFHNAIEEKNKTIKFIDFEYFGWDDPAKLIADFCFHPGMKLSPHLKEGWIDGAIDIYGGDVSERLRLIWPLVGLSWCLILLNEFKDDIWQRRCSGDRSKLEARKEILELQLDKSRALLKKINQKYNQTLIF